VVFWTRRCAHSYDHVFNERASVGCRVNGVTRRHEVSMVAVIGNVIAGLLALSLFTATVRLSK